jgi:hypothetical protein
MLRHQQCISSVTGAVKVRVQTCRVLACTSYLLRFALRDPVASLRELQMIGRNTGKRWYIFVSTTILEAAVKLDERSSVVQVTLSCSGLK